MQLEQGFNHGWTRTNTDTEQAKDTVGDAQSGEGEQGFCNAYCQFGIRVCPCPSVFILSVVVRVDFIYHPSPVVARKYRYPSALPDGNMRAWLMVMYWIVSSFIRSVFVVVACWVAVVTTSNAALVL